MPQYRTVMDAHLGDNEFWIKPLEERDAAFAAMRHESKHGDGMCFHEEISVIEGGVRGPGFWSAVTYDDIKEVAGIRAGVQAELDIGLRRWRRGWRLDFPVWLIRCDNR